MISSNENARLTPMKSPRGKIFGHGAILSMRRLQDKSANMSEFYKDTPYSPPAAKATKEREPGSASIRPPESVFVRGQKYAGERGGFRVDRKTGSIRRFILRTRAARAAIVSALKIEEHAKELVAQESALAAPPAPAPKKRAPAKKKAAAE